MTLRRKDIVRAGTSCGDCRSILPLPACHVCNGVINSAWCPKKGLNSLFGACSLLLSCFNSNGKILTLLKAA